MSSKNINLQWRDQNPSSSSPCHDRQGPPLPAMASKASPPCRALPPLPAATSSMVAQIDAELGDARGCRDRGCRTMKLPDGGGAVTGSSDGGGATAVHRDLQHAEADGGEERDVITSAVQARASLAEVRLRRGEADGGEECCSVTTATMGSSSLSLSLVSSTGLRGGRVHVNHFGRRPSCFIFASRRKWNLKMNQLIEHPLESIYIIYNVFLIPILGYEASIGDSLRANLQLYLRP
jgi:hypothetical protein